MNERLLEIFSEVEEFHWWFVGRRYLLDKKIKQQFGKNNKLRILDIGCGTGGSNEFLSRFGIVYGVDSSVAAINFAKKKGAKNLKVASATKLPFKANTFDLVLALDVFEHIKNDQKALNEAKRVVKKGGVIILTVPALPFLWSKHDEMQKHFRRYTVERLKKIGEESGLGSKEISYFNSFFSPPIILIRKSSNVLWFRRLADYDSEINFEIAKVGVINQMLTSIIKLEIKLRRFVLYPIGISLLAIYKKR